MPTYEFQNTRGQVIERVMAADEAPDIGQVVKINGRSYRRIPSLPEPCTGGSRKTISGLASRSLPRFWPHAKRHTPDGKPLFDSRRECEEAVARSQDSPHDRVIKYGEL